MQASQGCRARYGPKLAAVAPVALTAWLTLGATALAAPNSHAAEAATTHASSSTSTSANHSGGTAGTSGDPTEPQPLSTADQNSGGANGQCPGATYCSTRDGSPSGNGNGGGQAVGKPCAGCVGKADNKNPPGQESSDPFGTFPNNGHECDHNNGIGKTNPAHTGCQSSPPEECVPSEENDFCQPPEECVPSEENDFCQPPEECVPTEENDFCQPPEECVPSEENDFCQPPGGEECIPTAANNFCTTVRGERTTRTPGQPEVLGEQVTRPPAALPFTGAPIGAMLAVGLLTLVVGLGLTAAVRRS